MPDYIDPTKAQFAAFRELGGEGAIHMLNLIRLRDRAVYEDGRDASGREAYQAYGRATADVFTRVGGKQFWIGTPELTVIGPSDEHWDIIFIAEYPNPAAFVEMLRDPHYREAVKHRQAAVADSRLIRLRPRAPGGGFGEF